MATGRASRAERLAGPRRSRCACSGRATHERVGLLGGGDSFPGRKATDIGKFRNAIVSHVVWIGAVLCNAESPLAPSAAPFLPALYRRLFPKHKT